MSVPAGRRILLVGCGKMGRALAQGWLDRGLDPRSLIAVDLSADASRAGIDLRVRVVGALADTGDFQPDWVVLAVKPQTLAAAAAPYRRFVGSATFLSILAGKTLAGLSAALGGGAIVRSMPNTPAAVGRGITVACAGPGVSAAARRECTGLLEAVGEVAWIEDEALMDAVTAVSGSGPAYVFLLIECLAEAGIAAGLPPPLAHQLARATVAGSGELAHLSSEPAAVLRQNVTSPGGTTEAALKVLMAPGALAKLLQDAVAAAAQRSRELAG